MITVKDFDSRFFRLDRLIVPIMLSLVVKLDILNSFYRIERRRNVFVDWVTNWERLNKVIKKVERLTRQNWKRAKMLSTKILQSHFFVFHLFTVLLLIIGLS